MKTRPELIVFDIIGTVMSIEPLRKRFEAIGEPGSMLETWFASGLRDAFAIAAAGGFRPFSEVLDGALDQLIKEPDEQKKSHIVSGMKELTPHPDALSAFQTLAEAGYRIAALSNGAAATTTKLLADAGLDRFVERVGSVDDVQASKPKREVYLKILDTCGVDPGTACLVATHAWDVNGAMAAGLQGVFIARGKIYPRSMRSPDLNVESLDEAAKALAAL